MYIVALKDFKWSISNNEIISYEKNGEYEVHNIEAYNDIIKFGYGKEVFPELYGNLAQYIIDNRREYRRNLKSSFKEFRKYSKVFNIEKKINERLFKIAISQLDTFLNFYFYFQTHGVKLKRSEISQIKKLLNKLQKII